MLFDRLNGKYEVYGFIGRMRLGQNDASFKGNLNDLPL